VPVTFDPKLFDQHPSTLRLLSYDEDLFKGLLDAVDAPVDTPGAPMGSCGSRPTPRPPGVHTATSRARGAVTGTWRPWKGAGAAGFAFRHRALDAARRISTGASRR